MQKSLLLLSLFIYCSFSCIAQPILNQSNSTPVIGDMFNYGIMSSPTISSNFSNGANQTWDMSTLMATSSDILNVLTPAGSPFSSASVKMSYVTSPSQMYFTNSSSIMELSGAVANSVTMTYSNNETFLQFPFQMGSTFNDTWQCSFTNGMTFYRTGVSNIVADGYGTLKLPSGNYGNVLKVTTIRNYNDSVAGVGIIYNYVDTIIYFYLPGNHQPIASMVTSAYSSGAGTALIKNASFLINNIVTSDNDIATMSKEIQIYPNPVTNSFYANVEGTHGALSFKLINLLGGNIPIESEKISDCKYHLNVNSVIVNGYYYLEVIDNKKVIARKSVLLNH